MLKKDHGHLKRMLSSRPILKSTVLEATGLHFLRKLVQIFQFHLNQIYRSSFNTYPFIDPFVLWNYLGLKRCGKSCRLRWLNYLRPNIKHGGFSEEEDNIICSLYISIGSRYIPDPHFSLYLSLSQRIQQDLLVFFPLSIIYFYLSYSDYSFWSVACCFLSLGKGI